MKQIIYGPTGFGKTHLILHSLKHKRKVILISSNGVAREMEHVGLSPLPKEDIFKLSSEEGTWKLNHKTEIGFDIIGFVEEQTYALEQLFTTLEKSKITKNADYTIVLLNMYCLILNKHFVKRMEKWSADVIIDHTCTEREADIEIEMGGFRKSGKWTELFLSTDQKPKAVREKNFSYGTHFSFHNKEYVVVGEDTSNHQIECQSVPADDTFYWFEVVDKNRLKQIV